MAYGTGYIPKGKSRDFNKQRTTSGGYSTHETRHRDGRGTNEYETAAIAAAAGSSRHAGAKKDKTDEEILALGRQLSDFAKKQNEHDLRSSGKIKATGLMAAAAAVNEVRKKRRDAKTRGIATSRPHGDYSDSSDDSDWEDASDDEGGFSDAESALAYGSVVSHAIRPTRSSVAPAMSAAAGVALGAGAASIAGRSGTSSRPAESLPATNVRKSSVVDPRLFGPYNSLRGMINTPCGFGDNQPAADHHQFNKLRRAETEPIYKDSMKNVYPMPTADPGRFDAGASSAISSRQDLPYRSRPAPIPLQQPSPKAPVSSKVYQAEKLEEESQKHSRTRSDETGVGAGTKLTGLAAAAAAAVALASDRKSKRDSRREERRLERKDGAQDTKASTRATESRDGDRGDYSKRRDRDAESEVSRKSKRDSYSSKYQDERDHKRHSRYEEEETPRKRRETKVDHYPEEESSSRRSKRSDRGDRDIDSKSELSRSSRRDSRKFDDRDERRKDEKTSYDQAATVTTRQPVDPFQFQVAESALGSSLVSAATAPARPLTPTVVTVDREPNFDEEPPRLAQSDTRLSRKDSFEIERMVEDYKRGARNHPDGPDSRRHDYEEREHEARNIYEEAKQSTAPVAAAAVASAIAVEMARSRGHRDGYTDEGSRDYTQPRKDPVQEEADRYYREMITAERIAAEEQRSRSASPNQSVINKYEGGDQKETYSIVTPPEMEDKTSKQSLFDGPDADVKIDNKIYPKELHKFRSTDTSFNLFTSRDPSCERERPMLNLVYPTPVPSRQPTPSLSRDSSEVGEQSASTGSDQNVANDNKKEDEAQERGKSKDKKKKKKKKSTSKDDFAEDGGEVASGAASTVSSTAKSVTWGENSMKSFEVESADSRSDAEATRDKTESGDKSRPVLSKTSQWGILAAAIAGSSSEPANEPDVPGSRSKKKASSDVGVGYRDKSERDIDDLMDDAKSEPPIPGPKPVSPTAEKMPGGYADDIEFAATLAAGLKDTGFDPNIVIDDPEYRRRDSPPRTSDTNGDGWSGSSFADAVSDITSKQKGVSEPGFFSEPVDMTREDPTGPSDEWVEAPKKLSKKEKKRFEKEAKRQSMDIVEPLAPEPSEENIAGKSLEEKDLSRENDNKPRETDNAEWEDSGKKKRSKKDRKSRDFEDDTSSKLSRTDSFDKSTIRVVDPDDDWDMPKKSKSKSKSKRDSVGSEAISRSAPGSEVGERESSSKRSSRSTPGSEVGENESSGKHNGKSKRRSGTDFDDYGDDPPDRKGDPWDDRDVSSVVSEARGDERRRERRSKRSSLYDDDDAKSVASAPGSSRKSKRSSLYEDDDAAKSSVSLPGSPRRSKDKETEKSEKRSSGLLASIFKTGSKDSKDDSKKLDKESFLDNAGTLGAGVGLATVAAAVASASRSNAAQASFEKDPDSLEDDKPKKSGGLEDFDPEIAPRAIKPAIDPQYGDLLPLPPSEPGSPKTPPEDLPALPDSRPDTPPEERTLKRDFLTHRRRRSTQDTPMKSPSSTAIPISLRLGQRHSGPPSSPSAYRSPPSGSPVTTPESSRRSARISWDSSKEIKPLYLLEHSRQGSVDNVPQMDLPELPPSEPSEPPSRESPAPGYANLYTDEDVSSRGIGLDNLADVGLRIDTSLASSVPIEDIAGSQETTPKATRRPELPFVPADEQTPEKTTIADEDPAPVDSMSKDRSSYLLNSAPSSTKSNKSTKSETGMASRPESTPTKHLAVESSLADIAEDLTSADEHFSDALEGPHSDTFEEAQDWFDDIPPSEPAIVEEAVVESTPKVPQPAVAEYPDPTPSTLVDDDAESEEWKGMSAKEKRKAKKSRKSKDLSLAEAAVVGSAAATTAVVAPLLTEEPSNVENVGEPASPQVDFEQPKKGKKGKKNKKKSLSLQDDLGDTPSVQPTVDETTLIAGTDAPEATETGNLAAIDTSTDIAPPETADQIAVTDDTRVKPHMEPIDTIAHEATKDVGRDAISETVMEPAEDTSVDRAVADDAWEAPSKKNKKKKKKSKDASSWDVEPAIDLTSTKDSCDVGPGLATAGESDVMTPAETSSQPEAIEVQDLTLDKDTPVETSTELAASTEPVVFAEPTASAEPVASTYTAGSTEPAAFAENNAAETALEVDALPTEQPTVPDPEELWSAPSSKKDKKKKKKKGLQVDEPLPVERELQPEPALSIEHSENSKTEPDLATEPAAESVMGPVTEYTAKDPLALDQVTEPAEPEPEPEFTSVSSKGKKKKKKNKQVEEPLPVEATSEPTASSELQPTTETTHDHSIDIENPATGDSVPTSQEVVEAVEASEAEFAPVSKSKKKKKKGRQADDSPLVDQEAETSVIVDEQSKLETAEESTQANQQTTEPAEAGEDEFAPVSRGKKKKKKSKSAQIDDSLPVDKGLDTSATLEERPSSLEGVVAEESLMAEGAEAGVAEKTPVTEEPPVVEQVISTSEDISKEESGTTFQDTTEPDFEPASKGKKKNKKKKSKQLDEDLPLDKTLELTATTNDQRTTTILPDQTFTDEPSSTENTSGTREPILTTRDPVEARDADFEPVSTDDKQKKVLYLDEASPADTPPEEHSVLAEQIESIEPVVDSTPDGKSPATEVSLYPQATTEATEDDFAPVTKGKKKKKDKRKSVQWEDPAPVTTSESPDVASDALVLGSSVTPEPLTIDKADELQPAEQSRSLDAQVSEPLFSQGDAPLELTQDDTTSVEPTQLEGKTLGDVAMEDSWTETVSTKKKGKKTKTGQANVWDLLEEKPGGDITPDPVSTLVDKEHINESQEEPVSEIATEVPREMEDTKAAEIPQEAQAEDEWATPASNKKSKKKKKGSKSASISNPEPATETQVDTVEPALITEEPAAIEETQPAVEPEPAAPILAENEEEWPQAIGKKRKKKKRQSLTAEPVPEGLASTEPPTESSNPREDAPDVTATAVDHELEFEVPKKGKKSKKKKNSLAFEYGESSSGVEADSAAQPPQQPAISNETSLSENLLAEPEVNAADKAPTDVIVAHEQPASEDNSGVDKPLDDAVLPDTSKTAGIAEGGLPESLVSGDDSFVPAKLSKKDRKMKKKQATMEAAAQQSVGEPSPEPAVAASDASAEALCLTGTMDSPVGATETLAKTPSAGQIEETEAIPEDLWGGFSLKPKKDKKKKKTKDTEFEKAQEPEPIPETDLAAEPIQESSSMDSAKPVTDLKAATTFESERSLEPESTNDDGTVKDQEEAGKADDNDEWAAGTSRKEKKKQKQKAKDLGMEADVSSKAVEETFVSDDVKTTKAEEVGDDSWTDTMSKKDKKKKNKKAKQGSQYDYPPPQSTPIQDANDIYDAAARPEAEQVDPLELATTAQNTGDTERSDATPCDVTFECHQKSADVQQESQESKDITMTEDQSPQSEPEIAESSAPITPQHDTTVLDPSAQPSGDRQVPVAKDELVDDEWSIPDSGKKRKGKQNKKSKVDFMPWDEPNPDVSAQPVEKKSASEGAKAAFKSDQPPGEFVEPRMTDRDSEMMMATSEGAEPTEFSTEPVVVKDAPATVELPSDLPIPMAQHASPSNQDESNPEGNIYDSAMERKLSKKEKKRKKQLGLVDQSYGETPDTDLRDSTAVELSDAVSTTNFEPSKHAPLAKETSTEPDEWLGAKKSKNDKKKAAKAALATSVLTAAAAAASTKDSTKNLEEEDRQIPREEPIQFEGGSSWADEMEDVAPIIPAESDTAVVATPKDDEFGFTTSAKSKKGKKAKNKAKDSSVDEYRTPEATPAAEPVQTATQDTSEAAVDEPLNVAETVEEDEWAMPSKKKGKKGKKSKPNSGTITPADTTTPPESTILQVALEDPGEPAEPAIPSEPGEGDTAVTETEPPAKNDLVDEWALPSKKKGKKGKKGQSRSGILTPEESQPAGAAQESLDTEKETVPIETEHAEWDTKVAEPSSVVDMEEEWALPSKKKGKKGKKDKSERGTITPANEPSISPDQQQETVPTAITEEDPRDTIPGDEVSRADVAVPDEFPRALDPEQPPHSMDNDDTEGWGLTVKKKKGKKNKSGSGSMTPTAPPDISEEPTTDKPFAAEEVNLVQEDPAMTALPEVVGAPQSVDVEDEWAVPTKKKKGKGKKSKSIPLAALDEPLTMTSEAETGPAGERGLSAMEIDDTTSAENVDWRQEEGKPEERDIDTSLNTSAVQNADDGNGPVSMPEPSMKDIMAEANAEAASAAPMSRKSKKDKKRKSSQIVVLDSPQNEIGGGEQDPSIAEVHVEDASNDEWPDNLSVPKSKKQKNKKAAESPAEPFEDILIDENVTPMDESRQAEADSAEHDRHMGETRSDRGPGDSVKDDDGRKSKSEASTTEALATAGAVAGGVALLAEKFGGGKKKKGKGKQKKILDKRQPQQDDMFDDPALWEGADKKALDDGKDAELHEDFWGGAADSEEKHEEKEENKGVELLGATSAKETKHGLPTPMSGSFTESDGGWAETAQHGVPLDDEFAESPILGRGEAAPMMTKEPVGLLRRSTDVGEPVGGLLKERSEPEPMIRSLSSESDFRRSPTRGLPAVQEVPEAEAIAAEYNWPTPEMNRDSGFAAESPHPRRRRSPGIQDEQQRDSGVHTDDYGYDKMQTPDVSGEKRTRRSPFATPVLQEPEASAATPEPEKKISRKATKGYGEVASRGGIAAATAGAGLAANAALSQDTPERRSVSDNTYNYASGSASSTKASHESHDGRNAPPRADPVARRSVSNTSLSRQRTPEPLKLRPESPGITGLQGIKRSTPTPPLRRIDKRMSGDLRALRQQRSSSSTTPTPTASDTQVLPPPVANESRVRSKGEEKGMADVYDGYGEGRIGSPRSPTRPHSMRRRQSMQVLELESKVEQLIAENRMLTEARTHAEQNLSQKAASVLSERDSEIESLKQSLQFLHNEVARLTEVNEGLTSANAELASKDNGRFTDMTRELNEARGAHTTFTQSLQDKDAEIADLRAQLEAAKQQIREMQRKILESKAGDSEFLNIKDEDYFDHRCQQLCSHVQQWVLRFSKFSDMRACRLTSEINDEKTIDRLDNAILDGTDVDTYLRDRVKRRDIFMSMTMNMIWEFVFTRYLFGMDREQRQKLKSLEKLLTDVGPPKAVRQWRAVTLTLLSKRSSFRDQRDLDTEAVVQAVFQTLCKILPPPSNLEGQIQSQLRRVMHEAVDLSVEMRTQRAEYMMLPPLQPEYDADGELAATVSFDAAMMNERSGNANKTNEELEAQGAVVRIVLFPLVVKRGDDDGSGEDKIVVCPAQVLIARDDRSRRHYTPSSEAGGASLGAPSHISLAMESVGQAEP